MRIHLSLVDVAIVLALAIVAVVGYKYSPVLLAPSDLVVEPLGGCDLNARACRADLPDGGRVELRLTPNPVPVAKPLQVQVSLSGVEASKVEIDFAGVDMNMGFNRKALAATGNGLYAAEAILPVCVTGRMAWRATVMLESGRRRIAVPFVFEAPVGGV